MTQDMHQRARHLTAAARVEGISAADQAWLEEHLETCAACAQDAAETRRALEALRWMAVNADPGMVRATRLQMRMRARELDEARSRSLLLWASGVFTTAFGMVTLPLLWRGFAWAGQQLHLPDAIWQLVFMAAWFLPAVVVALMLWKQPGRAQQSSQVQSRGMK